MAKAVWWLRMRDVFVVSCWWVGVEQRLARHGADEAADEDGLLLHRQTQASEAQQRGFSLLTL